MAKEHLWVRGCFPGTSCPMDIEIRQGYCHTITRSGRREPTAGNEKAILLPGLTDIQINGAGGFDLQSPSLTVDTIYNLNQYLHRHGVFYWFPTLITDSAEALEHKCRVLALALKETQIAPFILGIHLEGPHISPADGPRGAHPVSHVCPPNIKLFQKLQRAAEGHIRLVTLAPELPGAIAYIRQLCPQNVVVALGHHAATPAQIHAAVEAGARLCTHLGNGIATQLHRHHNPLWAQLAEDRLFASVIADLEHVPPEMLKVIWRTKAQRRVILISDSVFLTGEKPGRYRLFDAEVELQRTGRVCLAGTELLAGSSTLLPQAIVNMWRVCGGTLSQCVASAYHVPARLLGIRVPPWPPRPGTRIALAVYPGHFLSTRTLVRPEFIFATERRMV